MTNYQKMLELTGSKATKEGIKGWAYMNRVSVSEVYYDEPFECMKASAVVFMGSGDYNKDEHKNWDKFLDCEYVGGAK